VKLGSEGFKAEGRIGLETGIRLLLSLAPGEIHASRCVLGTQSTLTQIRLAPSFSTVGHSYKRIYNRYTRAERRLYENE
jgi:hypothetical protein